jgi:hypothetical protein
LPGFSRPVGIHVRKPSSEMSKWTPSVKWWHLWRACW